MVVVMRRLKPQKHQVHVGDARNWDQAPRSRVAMLVSPCWFELSRLRATLAMSLFKECWSLQRQTVDWIWRRAGVVNANNGKGDS